MARIHRIATIFLVGTIFFAGKAAVAEASEEPVAGMALSLDEFYQNAQDKDEAAVHNLLEEISTENNLAFAQVSSYVNIRSKPSEEGEILGKLYDNSAATILEKADRWYRITSGSVTGYIKAEFLITGEKAAKMAESLGTRLAIVNTTTLKVREEASTDARILNLSAMGDDFKVVKELDGWIKVKIDDNSYGFLAAEYVTLQTVYEEAVSMEEEQERLAEEAAADNPSNDTGSSSQGSTQSSSQSSIQSSLQSSSNSSQTNNSEQVTTDTDSIGGQIAAYALQFVGNPYVWGGTSLTNGADCSGFTQSVFRHFGISISRTSRTQATGGKRVSISELQPGDLIFYARNGTINHVAIYIGGGQVISASSPATGIRVTRYNYREPYKAVRYN